MKILLLVGLCISTALCQFQLTRQSYTTFPSTSGGTPSLFSNAAHQASYDPQERILYVLGKLLLQLYYELFYYRPQAFQHRLRLEYMFPSRYKIPERQFFSHGFWDFLQL